MDEDLKIQWQRVVDKFTLQKSGMNPWDAILLSKQHTKGQAHDPTDKITIVLH